MPRPALLSRALIASCFLLPALPSAAAAWQDALAERIARLDRDSPGALGVFVKRLDNGETFSHGAEKRWYLGSTAKVPIAVAVLQQVDAGKLRLSQQVQLRPEDKVDGSGQLVWSPVGSRWRIDALLERMLGVSDNTAANLLIRTVGIDALNASAAQALGEQGAGRFTDFSAIRYDVYAQLHPDARKLSHQQLVQVAAEPLGPRRVEAVRRAIGVPPDAMKLRSIDQAYARYYDSGVNSATLVAYGGMLEQLVRGKLLSPSSTDVLFRDMKFGRRGDYRLEGGIPKSEPIIHKTGTQYRRACHMAVINPQNAGARGIVVATCAADLDDQKEAGPVFRRVGEAVSQVLLARGEGAK